MSSSSSSVSSFDFYALLSFFWVLVCVFCFSVAFGLVFVVSSFMLLVVSGSGSVLVVGSFVFIVNFLCY